jgi:hypothetical protein
MFFRGANSIEGGSTWFFRKKLFSADSNEIGVSYCLGYVEFRHRESSGPGPILLVW